MATEIETDNTSTGTGNYLRSLVPKVKAICCLNCKWQNNMFCTLRFESCESDEVCNYHPRISGTDDMFFEELEAERKEMEELE